MKITLQTPGVEIGQSLLIFIREKVEKLSEMFGPSIEIDVTLKLSRVDIRENKICAIRCEILGKQFFAEKRSATFKHAVVEALEISKKQIIENCKVISAS